MAYEDRYKKFGSYLPTIEPRRKVDTWQTMFGLQDVDILKNSDYLLDTAYQHIEGNILIAKHN